MIQWRLRKTLLKMNVTGCVSAIIIIAKRQVKSYKAIFVHKSYNLKKFIFDENMGKEQAFNKP